MDASKLETVDILNAIQWIALFLKHKDTTSEFVTCSCLVTTSVNVKQGVDEILFSNQTICNRINDNMCWASSCHTRIIFSEATAPA